MDIEHIFAFPWGVAILDSDGFFEGVTAWRWGEASPFLDEPCCSFAEAMALLALVAP